MKITMRKWLYSIGVIASAVVYYLLFFTKIFGTELRQLTYVISGSNSALEQNIASGGTLIKTMDNAWAPTMYRVFISSAQSEIQFGPYFNLTVYMLTFFIVVPLFLVSVLVFQKYNRVNSFADEKEYGLLFKKNFFNYLFTAFLISAVGNVLSQLLARLLQASTTPANQESIQRSLQSNFLITAIPIVILAPIIEEIVFRGVILSGIKQLIERFTRINTAKKVMIYKKYNIAFHYAEIIAIILSATLFAVIHLTSNFNQWIYFPTYFCAGVALGGVYVLNKERLYASIAIHAAYNAIPLLFMLVLRTILGG